MREDQGHANDREQDRSGAAKEDFRGEATLDTPRDGVISHVTFDGHRIGDHRPMQTDQDQPAGIRERECPQTGRPGRSGDYHTDREVRHGGDALVNNCDGSTMAARPNARRGRLRAEWGEGNHVLADATFSWELLRSPFWKEHPDYEHRLSG